MATMAGSRIFVDTNVLVYAAVLQSPFHTEARNAIARQQDAGTELWISRQVVREYLATLSRPQTFSIPHPADVLIADVLRFMESFSIAEDSSAVTARLLELMARIPIGGRQVHDANIVATMLSYDIGAILTHNAADYNRFAGLITVLNLTERK
jgi:predicted nucleic acid-binding protein